MIVNRNCLHNSVNSERLLASRVVDITGKISRCSSFLTLVLMLPFKLFVLCYTKYKKKIRIHVLVCQSTRVETIGKQEMVEIIM